MAKLAIKGHSTRGSEVIALLEMVGGKNGDCSGKNIYAVYAIPNNGYIYPYQYAHNKYPDDFIIFTLEEFLEKYPYKVGDRVSSKYLKNYKIEKAEWTNRDNRVIYKLQGMGWYSADELQPYKEEIVEEKTVNSVYPISKCKTIGQSTYAIKIVDGYKFDSIDENGNIIVKSIKPQYPKTYEECCNILNLPHCGLTIDVPLHYSPTIICLTKLLICRDAYWKIAGEQMGWTSLGNLIGKVKSKHITLYHMTA